MSLWEEPDPGPTPDYVEYASDCFGCLLRLFVLLCISAMAIAPFILAIKGCNILESAL